MNSDVSDPIWKNTWRLSSADANDSTDRTLVMYMWTDLRLLVRLNVQLAVESNVRAHIANTLMGIDR